MKNSLYLLLPLVMLATTSCYKCVEKREVKKMIPVYMSEDELRESISMTSKKALTTVGNIYFKDDFLFITEPGEGVHVIKNTDPYAPENIGFIEIPGNSEVSIKNDIMIANSSVDLVSIRVSNPAKPVEVGRLENAFPLEVPVAPNRNVEYVNPDASKGVVISWRETIVERENPCN